jgi:hypothetical protein
MTEHKLDAAALKAIQTYYGEVYDEHQLGGAYSIIGVPSQDYLAHVDALLAHIAVQDAEIAALRKLIELAGGVIEDKKCAPPDAAQEAADE